MDDVPGTLTGLQRLELSLYAADIEAARDRPAEPDGREANAAAAMLPLVRYCRAEGIEPSAFHPRERDGELKAAYLGAVIATRGPAGFEEGSRAWRFARRLRQMMGG